LIFRTGGKRREAYNGGGGGVKYAKYLKILSILERKADIKTESERRIAERLEGSLQLREWGMKG